MNIDVLTLFPEMLEAVLNTSIIGRAQAKGLITVNLINIRDFSENKHKSVDDYPFGGGLGMVMQAQPVFSAMKSLKTQGARRIYFSPKGNHFTQDTAKELIQEDHLILLCGHYEGIDQRIIDYWITDEISIGDYILTGGEIPAMVLIDAVARMIPGVLSSKMVYENESIYSGLLECPHYTRPREYEGMKVPEVLISGNHGKIEEWQYLKSLAITKERRKDLFEKYLKKRNELPEKKQKEIKTFLGNGNGKNDK